MTKIVALVLLFAVVLCSVFGLSCNQFNDHFISASDLIIQFSTSVLHFSSTVTDTILPETYNPSGAIVDTGNTVGDNITLVSSNHTECYDYYVRNFSSLEKSTVNINYYLYSVEILSNGEYHYCYCIGFKNFASGYNKWKDDICIVISDLYNGSLVGWVFIKKLAWLSTYGGLTFRSYKNLEITAISLDIIPHECQIQNGG